MQITYAEMARRLGVDMCEGPCEWGNAERHWKGGTARNTVHWYRERMTRAGAYVFLKMCGGILLGHNRDTPTWQSTYEQSAYAVAEARRTFGMVISSDITVNDRLRVRATLPPGSSMTPAARWAYKEAV